MMPNGAFRLQKPIEVVQSRVQPRYCHAPPVVPGANARPLWCSSKWNPRSGARPARELPACRWSVGSTVTPTSGPSSARPTVIPSATSSACPTRSVLSAAGQDRRWRKGQPPVPKWRNRFASWRGAELPDPRRKPRVCRAKAFRGHSTSGDTSRWDRGRIFINILGCSFKRVHSRPTGKLM